MVTSGYCVRLTDEASRRIELDTVARGDFVNYAEASELHKLATMHRKAWCYNLLHHPTKPSLRSTDFSIARSDFERVNGFDERFRGWGGEDDDLGRRLKAAGVRHVSVLDKTRVYHLWHPPVPSKTAEWREGNNVAYLQRPLRLTRCVAGLVPRKSRDLTVRLAGEAHDQAALSGLIHRQGWRVQCDSHIRADLELLPWPGRGRFRGQGDCRVLVLLEEVAQLPWCARRADAVVSSSATDVFALWQLLTDGSPRAVRDELTRPSVMPTQPMPQSMMATMPSPSFVSSPS